MKASDTQCTQTQSRQMANTSRVSNCTGHKTQNAKCKHSNQHTLWGQSHKLRIFAKVLNEHVYGFFDGTGFIAIALCRSMEKYRVNGLLLHFNGLYATVNVLKTRNDIEQPNANKITLFFFQQRLKAKAKQKQNLQ